MKGEEVNGESLGGVRPSSRRGKEGSSLACGMRIAPDGACTTTPFAALALS